MSPFYRKMRVKETAHVEKLATMTVTADTTLQPEDSGKVIFMNPTGIDITLPDPPFSGFNIRVILNADNVTTACTITADGTGEFFAGSVSTAADGAATAIFDGSTTDVISFATTADQGDYVDIISDGSTWFVTGQCFAATAITAETS
jgi:hypothetical protein